MSWFKRGKRRSGWLALQVREDRIDLVHATARNDGRPEVSLCDSFTKEQSDAVTLARLRKELKLDRFRCTTLLGSDRYQLYEIDAPHVPAAELKGAVRWRMKDFVDYPVESATVEVLRIPNDPQGAAHGGSVYAIAAKAESVDACAAPFLDAGIPLEAVDITELAQRNVASLFEPEHDGGIAMLGFYAEGGLLTFTRAGELYAARRIEIPLAQLMDNNYKQRAEHLERIALEVQRSLDHFERQYHYVPLAKLILGPLPKDIGLREYLASSIDGPVEDADLATVVETGAVPELGARERQSQYLPLIGAALRAEEFAA